jgi:hypothetical protein
MHQRPFEGGWVLRLETGEPVMERIAAFCDEQGIEAGSFSGIGALKWAKLGYYDQRKGSYAERRFDGGFELLSLVGNLSRKSDGTLFPHGHAVLSGSDFKVIGGHLFEGEVGPTLELYIYRLHDPITRVPVEGSHLEVLDLRYPKEGLVNRREDAPPVRRPIARRDGRPGRSTPRRWCWSPRV